MTRKITPIIHKNTQSTKKQRDKQQKNFKDWGEEKKEVGREQGVWRGNLIKEKRKVKWRRKKKGAMERTKGGFIIKKRKERYKMKGVKEEFRKRR